MQTPEELRVDARRLIEASKRSSDQKRKERYAERALELAQLAEDLSRRDEVLMPMALPSALTHPHAISLPA